MKILYDLQVNLSSQNNRRENRLLITEDSILTVQDGDIKSKYNIADFREVKTESLTGSGRLWGFLENDEAVMLTQFTKDLIAPYATAARTVNYRLQEGIWRYIPTEPPRLCPECGRKLPEDTDVCPKCVNRSAAFKRLLKTGKPYTWLMAAALFFFLGTTAIQIVIPRIYRIIVDTQLEAERGSAAGLMSLVALIGILQLFFALFGLLRGRVMARVGNGIVRDLRAMVFAKVQALSLGFIHKQKTGSLINRINNDTNQIQRFMQRSFGEGIASLLMVAGIAAALFIRDWRLAFFTILPTPMVLIFVRFSRRFIWSMYKRQWRLMDKANSLLQDILSGMKVVKVFGREDHEAGRFRDASAQLRDITIRNEQVWSTLIPLFHIIFGFGQYLVLTYGGFRVLGGQMELGEIIQYSAYAAMFYGPLAFFTAIPRIFVEAMTASQRIFEVIDRDPEVRDLPGSKPLEIEGEVTFDKVTFGYLAHEQVLDRVSFTAARGEMIGIVGHSGAGKSTLINLLLRLYDPEEGSIRIDGVDLRDITQSSLRSQMGVVLQEVFLFSGTIMENIRYSKPKAAPEEVIRVAKIANAHDFIIRFPNGYDTYVGERGQRLSGGERQRIAIARAILHDPKILILDEATSSVDTETEQNIQDALEHLISGRTTFAIAHRLATLRNADRLLVLDHGKAAEIGTHTELMAEKGIYYNLITTQRKMSGAKGV